MKYLVTGASGYIGSALAQRLKPHVNGTTRRTLDLLELGDLTFLGKPDVVYLCAAKTRFIECESDHAAYRINVDAQIELASHFAGAKIIYLSSEAVEKALHTAYGMHKALCEVGLRAVCTPVIARICSKVSDATLPSLVNWLVGLAEARPGVHRWGR